MILCYMDSNVLYNCFGSIWWFFYKKCAIAVGFHKKHVPRELITRAIENAQYKDQCKEDVELFCYCQTPCDDSKPDAGCDDVHCSYKWIHFMCAKVKQPRKSQPWHCNIEKVSIQALSS